MKGKIFGGIFGLCVADAVGVPFEFCSREELKRTPVTDMCGYGTYHQPPGTWSDDTSMTLCLLDSLTNGLDYTDMMQRFLSWLKNAKYTPYHEVFDVGRTSRAAILRFAEGVPPLQCGGASEQDNGNGALMRILPLAFYLYSRFGADFFRQEEAVSIIHNVAALTHAHKRNQIACGIYLSIAGMLMGGTELPYAFDLGLQRAWQYYSRHEAYAGELAHYGRLCSPQFSGIPVEQIKSGGYVVDTLEAALWCLLNTDNYRDCVLKAVNLGEDTDTVAAAAGGLAGMYYGYGAIPLSWRKKIARADDIAGLCSGFSLALTRLGFEKISPYLSYFEQVMEQGRVTHTTPRLAGEDTFLRFIDDASNSGLMDCAYLSTIRKYGLEVDDELAKQIDTADLELTKAILTCYIRQERFCEGLWQRAIQEGIFLTLLKRLDKLVCDC